VTSVNGFRSQSFRYRSALNPVGSASSAGASAAEDKNTKQNTHELIGNLAVAPLSPNPTTERSLLEKTSRMGCIPTGHFQFQIDLGRLCFTLERQVRDRLKFLGLLKLCQPFHDIL
jgi:hypothetical protein